jgi:hypothetical protein
MIAEVTGGASGTAQKRYGIQEAQAGNERKRARVEDDDKEDYGR